MFFSWEGLDAARWVFLWVEPTVDERWFIFPGTGRNSDFSFLCSFLQLFPHFLSFHTVLFCVYRWPETTFYFFRHNRDNAETSHLNSFSQQRPTRCSAEGRVPALPATHLPLKHSGFFFPSTSQGRVPALPAMNIDLNFPETGLRLSGSSIPCWFQFLSNKFGYI